MNPSYARIKQNKDEFVPRFLEWIKLKKISHLPGVDTSESIDLSIDDDENWIGVSVLIFENGAWTVIQDLTGFLATKSPEDWRILSKGADLIFAGYNDSVPYGQFLEIKNGEICRDFLQDLQDPSENRDTGKSKLKNIRIESWIDVAGFVDEDEIAVEPDVADLYIFENQEQRSLLEPRPDMHFHPAEASRCRKS